MSQDRLLLIITRWKNEANHLSNQLEQTKNVYQQECFRLQQKLNQSGYKNSSITNFTHSASITNEHLLNQLLINTEKPPISNQIAVLCEFFVDSLKTLLLAKLIDEKEGSTIKFPPIVESIETNIKQIGNLIKKINENCSNELNKNSVGK